MTREEAINSFKKSNEQTKLNIQVHSRIMDTSEIRELEWYIERDKMAIEALEQEPKAEWIPISERLPVLRGAYKISDDVLITNGFEIDTGYLVERTGKIFWHYYGSEYEVGIKDEDNDATAWMPMPEPYKEG